MKHEDGIHEGDFVDVRFMNTKYIFGAEVLSTPGAIGESWVLKKESGGIVYVMFFDRMDRREARHEQR